MRSLAIEDYALSVGMLVDKRLYLIIVRAVSDEDEVDILVCSGTLFKYVKQEGVIFLVIESSDMTDDKLVLESELSAGFGTQLGIKSEALNVKAVWDHIEFTVFKEPVSGK